MYHKFTAKIVSLYLPFESVIDALKTFAMQENQGKKTLENLENYAQSFDSLMMKDFDGDRVISNEDIIDLLSEVEDHILTFPEQEKRFQEIARYNANSQDKLLLKILKYFKKILLRLSWFAVWVYNLFRRVAGKSLLTYKTAKQIVLHRQLAKYVFVQRFYEKFEDVLTEALENRESFFLELKALDHDITGKILNNEGIDLKQVEEVISSVQEKYNTFVNYLEIFFDELTPELQSEFEYLLLLVDTVEFPISKLSTSAIEKNDTILNNRRNKLFEKYNVRISSILDHWMLIQKVRKFGFKSFDNFEETNKYIAIQLKEYFQLNDQKTYDLLKITTDSFKEEEIDITVVEKSLNEELLKNQIPFYLHQILKLDLKKEIGILNDRIHNEISSINSSYNLPLVTKWENVKSRSHLKTLELDEIIEGWCVEYIKIPLEKESDLMVNFQNDSIVYLNELSGILEYTNEYLQSNVDVDKSQHIDEFKQGIERAKKRAFERISYVKTFTNEIEKGLQLIYYELIREITVSISPEQLKSKHIQMYRKRVWSDIKRNAFSFLSMVKKNGHEYYLRINSIFKNIRSKYSSYKEVLGLTVSHTSINSEMSNYLSETEAAIEKLPLMYQRLFSITPVVNAKFRIKRPFVVNQLEKAYSNWTSGKFAPTCLVGETGSGLTSLVNEFIEKFGHQYQVVRINPNGKIKTDNEFVKLLSDALNNQELKSCDEIREFILSSENRKIIILENIHKLYIRKMGGFNLLYSLFKLISETNSKVYWLNTCLFYTFKYFDYSIGINNYYAHIEMLDKLSNEQITESILNRHKFSGYKLHFIPPENYSEKRSFKKLTLNDKQASLQEDYFKRLFNYAQNNLSLALLFWMRSIVSVEDNTFNMQFKNLNLVFVNSLSSSQLATLYAMVLHGRMTIEDHMEVFNLTEKDSSNQLMVFVDDGIIVKKENEYSINPLIYRQVVNHLTSLNYIH